MSIFDIFNTAPKPATNPAPAQGGQGGQSTPGAIPNTAPNTGATATNTAPNGTLPTATPGDENKTPLDQFSELWKDTPNDGTKPADGIFSGVDPKKFMEIAGKIDFAKSINPEQLKAITAGGDGAVAALAAVMNSVAQHTYAQSAFATTKITEQALNKARERLLAELPTHIKRQNLSDSMHAENPMLSHPAVQPIVDAMKDRLAVKYPNASSTELAALAKQAVEGFASVFAPPKKEDTAKGGNKDETDWSTFLN